MKEECDESQQDAEQITDTMSVDELQRRTKRSAPSQVDEAAKLYNVGASNLAGNKYDLNGSRFCSIRILRIMKTVILSYRRAKRVDVVRVIGKPE